MRCTNLLAPLAIVAGTACLLAAAYGAVPVPPLWSDGPEQPASPPSCQTLPYIADPAAQPPQPAGLARLRVCTVPTEEPVPAPDRIVTRGAGRD